MSGEVDLYDSHYGHLGTDVQSEVRRETYGEDLGQASWITAGEAREWFDRLRLGPGRRALEVACGSGGITCAMAMHTGADAVGIDVNEMAIAAALQRAARAGLSGTVSFRTADASRPLPFPEASFDAVFCNDSINHLPGRAAVLADWGRLLRAGGRVLYTDPIVVTGQLSNDEIRARSAIGFFLFTPAGENERLLERSGFRVLEASDRTAAVAATSRRWREARSARRDRLIAQEGEEAFEGLQSFLAVVHTLASEGRLSRYAYLAERA